MAPGDIDHGACDKTLHECDGQLKGSLIQFRTASCEEALMLQVLLHQIAAATQWSFQYAGPLLIFAKDLHAKVPHAFVLTGI